jgi:uncharacterized membrane protein
MIEENELQKRVAALEIRLDSALNRIAQLEGDTRSTQQVNTPESSVRISTPDIPPPPIQPQESAVDFIGPPRHPTPPISLGNPTASRPAPRPVSQKPTDYARLEYDFGAKVLPWAGAIVLIVAIGIFVANAIERGLITPPMQFAGAILLSLGFIGVGIRKHNEKEDFGKILIAIGSCGMYLSFAGGHVFLKLFSAETMITAFFVWSALNLTYGAKTRSSAFLLLGFFGGMAAALMPLSRDQFVQSIALQFFILIPALVIAVIQKLRSESGLIWASGFVGLLFAGTTDVANGPGAAAFVALALLGTAAYLYASDPEGLKEEIYFSGLPIFCTALVFLGLNGKVPSIPYLIAMGIGGIGLGLIKTRGQSLNPPLISGMASIFVLAPLCLKSTESYFTLIGIACLAAIIAGIRKSPALLPISWVNLATGVFVYANAYQALAKIMPSLQLGATAFFAVTLVVSFIVQGSLESDSEPISVLGILLLTPVMTLFFWQVGWMLRPTEIVAQLSVCYGLVVHTIVLTLFLGKKSDVIRALLWLILAGAGYGYLDIFQGIQPGIRAELPFMLLSLVGVYFVGKATLLAIPDDNRDTSIFAIGGIAGFLFARIFALLLTQTAISATKVNGSTMAFSLVGIICCGLIYWQARRAFGYLAWLFLFCAVGSTTRLDGVDPPMTVVVLMLAMISAVGWSSTRIESLRNWGPAIAIALNWYFFTTFVGVLIGKTVVLNQELTTTLSWIAYAILLLVIGFWRNQRVVRFGSIAIFAVSTSKMFLVDLAKQMDVLARVAILFLLGFAMLSGGYWYLRSRVIETPEPETD